MPDITFVLLIAAAALNGVVVGASLDQSIKQLPARHRIGAANYSIYSRAADLGNGIAWYGSVGIGAVMMTLAAAIAAYLQRSSAPFAPFIYLAAVLSILHSLVTTQAAPLMFSQRRHENDKTALADPAGFCTSPYLWCLVLGHCSLCPTSMIRGTIDGYRCIP